MREGQCSYARVWRAYLAAGSAHRRRKKRRPTAHQTLRLSGRNGAGCAADRRGSAEKGDGVRRREGLWWESVGIKPRRPRAEPLLGSVQRYSGRSGGGVSSRGGKSNEYRATRLCKIECSSVQSAAPAARGENQAGHSTHHPREGRQRVCSGTCSRSYAFCHEHISSSSR